MPVTANSIITPQAVKTAYAVTDTANTIYSDAPASTQLLVTAGVNGARLTRLACTPRATVTATMLQVYLSKDQGTTKRLLRSAQMAAHTVATTSAIPTTDFGFSETTPLILEAGDRLYVAQAVTLGAGIAWEAEWGDY